jgi:uncharacterized protein involved in outer membrane biogenesis
MSRPLFLSSLKSCASPRVRRCRWIAIGLLVYSIIGFFIVPAIVKSQLLKRLPALTHRQVGVKQVRINPFALSLTIRGLSLTETNSEPFAGFDEFYVNFQLSSVFRWAWTFSEIKLAHPTANIIRTADGGFNFSNLIVNEPAPVSTATNEPKSLPIVLIQHLVITNGDFHLTDQTRTEPFHIAYGPVNLDLKDFTTRRNKDGLYSLALVTPSGGNFSWTGTISANPPQSAGKFTLRGGALKTYSPYLSDFVRAEIADGILDIGAEYRLNAEASPLQFDATNVDVKLSNFQLKAAETHEQLLALDNVTVSGVSASLARREAKVPRVSVFGGSVLARREHDGQLNLLKLIVTKTNAVESASDSSTNAPVPWKAALDELNIEKFAVTVEDQVPPTRAQLGLDDLRLTVRGVSTQTNAPVSAMVEFNWRGGGTVHVEANGTLLPPAGGAKLALSQLALPPIQPYVEQQAPLVLNAGELTINGQARYNPGNTPSIEFTGDVSIAKFASIDTLAYHDFIKWDDFSVRGIQFTLQTNAVSVDEVKFTGLDTSLVVSSNGQLAIQALLKPTPSTVSGNLPGAATASGATTTVASAPAAEAFPIKVAALVFEKCSFRAADQSLEPHFNTSIEEFSGSIRDITWPGLTRASVDIQGKASSLAPFTVVGSVLPDVKNPFVDLKITMTNEDLTSFSPYTEKFAGYPLSKGKLSVALNYRIENRKLDAGNVIAIDQFTFGAHNESTNATKLPVKLAVNLLKDRNGRIDLDVPVTGSMDDPNFRLVGVIWRTIGNMIVKAVTSPFSLLGAMFGGGEELQYVDFAPGTSTLDPAQTNKLNTLAKALYERPALSLEIGGSVEAEDRELVSRQNLRDQMKARRLKELAARGKPTPSLTEFQIDPDDYERLLRQAYKEAFKMSPERALREAREAIEASNAPSASIIFSGSARPGEPTKGATRLLQEISGASGSGGNPKPSSRSDENKTVSVKPRTEAELVLDELEHRLAAAAPASDDDLRQLIQQRSLAVQKYLLDSGKVSADRIYVVAPKSLDQTTKSPPRVIFSLN